MDRDFYRWEYYGKISLTIKKNIRPIFKVLEFSCSSPEMSQAVIFLKQYFCKNQPFQSYDYVDVPLAFLPQSQKNILPIKLKTRYSGVSKKWMVTAMNAWCINN